MKFNNKTGRASKYQDNTKFRVGKPDSSEGSINVGLSDKMLKDLPKSSVTFKVDPYTNSMPHSIPYAALNVSNRKVGGTYGGEKNLDGGNVQQYANSERSGFLKYFDYFRLKIGMNYRYLPSTREVSDGVGCGLVDEQIKALSEAYSLLGATTYTQLALNDYVVETDMDMGSQTTETIDGHPVYTDSAAVFYAISKFYQEFWLELANCFNWHNSFRLKQGIMIRNAWNREVPQLNALFGLFNKAAWKNMLEGIALSFEGEYIDQEFISQANMINMAPSRRSNAILDPLMEIQTSYNHCTKFIMYVRSGDELAQIFNFNDITYKYGGNSMTIFQIMDEFNNRLAAQNVAAWARQAGFGNYGQTANNLFNTTVDLLNLMNNSITHIKTKFADFREAMDVLSRTGTVGWAKGYRPTVTQDTNADALDVLLVNDIYRLALAGSPVVEFNDTTKRWRSFSLWNMYTGIPEYDAYQGGTFLSMSCKGFNIDTDTDMLVNYVPVALTDLKGGSTDFIVYAVSRDGQSAIIKTASHTIQNDLVLARLAPLDSQSELEIRVPYIDTTNSSYSTMTTMHKSTLYKTMLQVFGLAQVTTSTAAIDIGIDPDIVAVYQYEIEDFTNVSIDYARGNAAIRATSTKNNFLGFFGTKMK